MLSALYSFKLTNPTYSRISRVHLSVNENEKLMHMNTWVVLESETFSTLHFTVLSDLLS